MAQQPEDRYTRDLFEKGMPPMTPPKFNVGDRVRVRAEQIGHLAPDVASRVRNQVGEVVSIVYPDNMPVVSFRSRERMADLLRRFPEQHLEPAP